MPSNFTENFNLSQWERADKVLMDDFNADNAKLDTALAAQAETLAAHTQALSRLGNCQVLYTTYTGNNKSGADNPTTLTFPHKPLLVIITASDYGVNVVMPYGCNHIMHTDGNRGSCIVTWKGNSVSWYSTDNAMIQMSGTTIYHVVALFAMD